MTRNERERILRIIKDRASAKQRVNELDLELRDAVLEAVEGGIGAKELAELTGLTRTRIYQIINGTR